MKLSIRRTLCAASSALAIAAPPLALAQDEAVVRERGGLDEIVVTARKREETAQQTPVALTAYGAEQIREQDLTNLEKISVRTPSFTVGRASNGSSAQLTLRGIGSSSTSIGIEQSVAVVVDDAYYGQGRVINEAFFDLGSVEVLKGPQALFFGKNATAGVVAVSTADPGDELEVLGRVGYEFNAQEVQLEGIVSGPLSDNLGARLAIRGTKQFGGLFTNVASPVTYTTFDIATMTSTPHFAPPAPEEAPGLQELVARLTLKYDPSERLTFTLKGYGTHSRFNNSSYNYVLFDCATGFSSLNPSIPCGQNFVTHQNRWPTVIAQSGIPYLNDEGDLYNDYRSWAITGRMDADLGFGALTSVTNYQYNRNNWSCACDFQSSNTGTWATEHAVWNAFSQEIRLLTDFDGRFNFLIGGLYQSTDRDFDQFIMFAGLEDSTQTGPNRFLATTKSSGTEGETFSGYAQAIFDLTDAVELAGGVRYTNETKDSRFIQPYTVAALAGIFVPGVEVLGDQKFTDWSPEATLSWQASDDILLYGAYKTGYKSGGFSVSGILSGFSTDPLADFLFNPETSRGFEFGAKTQLADDQVRLNLTYFRYNYLDLQVDFFNSPIFAFQTVTGDARTTGVEVEFEYAPSAAPGLSLFGVVNYIDAKYTDFIGPCYAGQTIAQGCTLVGPSGAPFQDLSGAPTSVAPKWTGVIGGRYEQDIGTGLVGALNVSARYSDDYLASGFGNPRSAIDSYVDLAVGASLARDDDRWELSLIGKNLLNEFYVTGAVDGPSTGSGTGTAVGVTADQAGFAALPRTVQLNLTVRY